MLEGTGATIDFRGVLAIGDPVVRGVLESSIVGALARVPVKQFRLTPRMMVLLFDRSSAAAVTGVLRHLQQQLALSHCGQMDWRLFELATEGDQFRSECRHAVEDSQFSDSERFAFSPESDRLGEVLHIIGALRTIDLGAHMREQIAYRISPDGAREPEFAERWVSLENIEQALGVPIRNNSWKFAHVTEFLDFKVLDHVTRDWAGDRVVSINIHCANVLAPQFGALVFRINPSTRDKLIFELPVADFLRDGSGAADAASRLRDEGFDFAVDGIVLPLLDQAAERVPTARYLKLIWNETFQGLAADQKKRVRDEIQAKKKGTFVLSRCDREADVEAGRALGFSVFQGWGVKAVASAARAKFAL